VFSKHPPSRNLSVYRHSEQLGVVLPSIQIYLYHETGPTKPSLCRKQTTTLDGPKSHFGRTKVPRCLRHGEPPFFRNINLHKSGINLFATQWLARYLFPLLSSWTSQAAKPSEEGLGGAERFLCTSQRVLHRVPPIITFPNFYILQRQSPTLPGR